MTLEERITRILNENSGGMKMTALVAEIQQQMRGQMKLQEFYETVENMDTLEIFQYRWQNKQKEFVGFKGV